MSDLGQLAGQVRARVADGLSEMQRTNGRDPLAPEDRRQYAVELIGRELVAASRDRLGAGRQALSLAEEEEVRRSVLDMLFGLGPLQRYVDLERVSNVEINGWDRAWVEWNGGRRERIAPLFRSDDDLIHFARGVVTASGGRWDRTNPSVSVHLPGVGRLHAEAWVCTRPALTLRIMPRLLTLRQLEELDTVPPALREMLECAVAARLNILVTGGPGAGKTIAVGALALAVPMEERIGTVEDPFEVGPRLEEDPERNVVCKEVQLPNAEGAGGFTATQLVAGALHQNLNRLIVGEVRGAEAVVMFTVMRAVGRGSMCSVHGDSPRGGLFSLQQYALQAAEHVPFETSAVTIAGAFDLVLHLAHLPPTHPRWPGRRVVTSVCAVTGYEGGGVLLSEVFGPQDDGRAAPSTPITGRLAERLEAAGLERSVLRAGRPAQWWG